MRNKKGSLMLNDVLILPSEDFHHFNRYDLGLKLEILDPC